MGSMSTQYVDIEVRRHLLAASTIDPVVHERRWEPLRAAAQMALTEWDRSGGPDDALNSVAASDPDLRS